MHCGSWFLLYGLTSFVSTSSYKDLQKLQETLFTDYSPNLRPVNTSSQQIRVIADISLSKIEELEEAREVMVTWFDLHLTWTDERLTWNRSGRYPDVETMSPPLRSVWTPRLQVMESFDKSNERQDDVIKVSSTGEINWHQRVRSETPCPLDIVKFPFDHQSCTVTFIIKDAIAAEVSFAEVNMNDNHHIKNGEWDITELTTKNLVVKEFHQNRSGFQLVFSLQRDRHYYMYNLIMPMFILITLNPFVLVIQCTSGERISVSVTLFLSFTIFMTQLSNIIPNSSSGEPWIAFFLYIHFHFSGDVVVYAIFAPRFSERFIRKYFSWLGRIGRRKNVTRIQTAENDLDLTKDSPTKGDHSEIDIERLRYRLDILGVVVYLGIASGMTMWLLYVCLL